jgi:DNA-binding transcriptional ArsR family regulator
MPVIQHLAPVAAHIMQLPAMQALLSMSLLHKAGETWPEGPLGWHADLPEDTDGWIAAAARQLTLEERSTNRFVFEECAGALVSAQEYQAFPAFLDGMAATPAELLLQQAQSMAIHPDDPEVMALFADPAAFKQLLFSHLSMVWERVMAAEWRKRTAMLANITQMVQQREMPIASAPAMIRSMIGRDLPPDITAQLAQIQTIVFVPAVHVGIFVAQLGPPETLWLFINWGNITGWALRQAPLKTAEIQGRMAALGDENALKILDLVAQHGECSAQKLIALTGATQSSISRHLKALGNYLIERRGEGANKHYQLNQRHLELSIAMLRRFLEVDEIPASQAGIGLAPQRFDSAPIDVAQAIRRFSDAQGRIKAFPVRRSDQIIMLEYLIERFEFERSYTEREVNEIIRAALSPVFDDYVTIRRELYSNKMLDRERDGSRYWRI